MTGLMPTKSTKQEAVQWAIDGSASRDSFRAAMRRIISGVTVITTFHKGRPWGMTVNAFNSVCVDPPTVLVCVNNRTTTATNITTDGRFAANILSSDQLWLSRRCARPGEAKFLDGYAIESADVLPKSVAMPVLRHSVVTFDCLVSQTSQIGSHFVMFATVEAILAPTASTTSPLLYGQGRYLHSVGVEETPTLTEMWNKQCLI